MNKKLGLLIIEVREIDIRESRGRIVRLEDLG